MREHGRKSISIHAPARGATFCHLLALLNTRNFNPRSREGSDGPSDVTLLTVPVFQSTLPRGERHLPQTRCPENVYFNPRSREGSDEDVTTKVDSLEISIHAPARGATSTYQHTHYSTRISIHAPARGATDFSDFFKFFLRISIHAPARGATQKSQPRGHPLVNFNPRSREGSDMPKPFKTVLMFHFNPRSREGSDCRSLFRFSRSCDFNPRSREGSDAILSRDPRNAEISIHAPARGATMQAQKRAILQRISIHAPARGATRLRLFWSLLS